MTLIEVGLEITVDALIDEYQTGFRKRRETVSQIFIMKKIITIYYEYKIPTVALFIEFKRYRIRLKELDCTGFHIK